MDCTALQDGAAARVHRVLGVSCPEAVPMQPHFGFNQTVVDAVKKVRPQPPAHDLAGGPAGPRKSALEQHAKMSFQARAKRPRLVRRLDHDTVARAKAE